MEELREARREGMGVGGVNIAVLNQTGYIVLRQKIHW